MLCIAPDEILGILWEESAIVISVEVREKRKAGPQRNREFCDFYLDL